MEEILIFVEKLDNEYIGYSEVAAISENANTVTELKKKIDEKVASIINGMPLFFTLKYVYTSSSVSIIDFDAVKVGDVIISKHNQRHFIVGEMSENEISCFSISGTECLKLTKNKNKQISVRRRRIPDTYFEESYRMGKVHLVQVNDLKSDDVIIHDEEEMAFISVDIGSSKIKAWCSDGIMEIPYDSLDSEVKVKRW